MFSAILDNKCPISISVLQLIDSLIQEIYAFWLKCPIGSIFIFIFFTYLYLRNEIIMSNYKKMFIRYAYDKKNMPYVLLD